MTLEQATARRLQEIRELYRSGDTGLTGKAMRRPAEEGGEAVGRRFRGFKNAFPELERIADTPAAIAKAIERGKGKVYARVVAVERDALLHRGFTPARRRSRGRLTVAPHDRLKSYCKHCEEFHAKGEHRFHGAASFHRTHLFSFGGNPVRQTKKIRDRRQKISTKRLVGRPNPAATRIYKPTRGVVLEGMQKGPGHRCDEACKRANHKYRHLFKEAVEVIGLPNGDVLLRGKKK